MESEQSPLEVELHGTYAVYLRKYSEQRGLETDEVVRRALGLFCLLEPALGRGDQVVVQQLHDGSDLPPVMRIDYFESPDTNADLSEKPPLNPQLRTHAELTTWPLVF